MEKLRNFLDKHFWLLVVAACLPAGLALLVPGFYGASDDVHIAWLYEIHKTILMGKLPPRFVPDLSFGFGYPLFNFVFPLPFYISEIFHLLGLNLVDSVKTLFFLSIPVSSLFMFYFLRQFCSKWLALAGAVLYVYTPYRSVDLYVRGAIGEVLSFVFLPLIFLSIAKLKNDKDLRWVGVGGLALASLVLSHNITAYMFLPFVALFFVLQIFFSSQKRAYFGKLILMGFLGLLISIYFWLPAVLDSSLMKYDTVFNFTDHYPTLLQLFTPYWGYGASVPGPGDGISFFLGSINIILFILGTIFTFTFWSKLEKDKRILLSWTLVSTISAVFLMNYRSQFIWNSIPFLPYFQFPWRFLMITTFSIPIFIIILDKFKTNNFISIIIIAVTFITTASYFRPQDFLGRQDAYYINRYIPTPSASREYLQTQEEYLRLPKNTQKRPDMNFPRATDTTNIKRIVNINDLDAILEVSSNKGTTINYNKYFFPGWVVKIDGKDTQVNPGSPFGQVTFFVPSGIHEVEISFKETNAKKALGAISLLSFLVSLWLLERTKHLKNN